jgi:group I intron endonuclease
MGKDKRVSRERICGVYSITNMVNNKVYIGSSVDIYGRWVTHELHLNKNIHHNSYLQRAWNKYGKDNFKFKVIEKCLRDKRIEVEQKWIKHYKSDDRKYGYNMCEAIKGPSNATTMDDLKNGKAPLSYEQFLQVMEAFTTTTDPLSQISKRVGVTYDYLYDIFKRHTCRELTQDYTFLPRRYIASGSTSEEQVLEIIERLKNRETAVSIAKKCNVNYHTVINIRQHKTWNELTKDIIFEKSDRALGSNLYTGQKVVQYDREGNYIQLYNSISEASRAVGVGINSISLVCKGQKLTAKGYVWRYQGDSFDCYRTLPLSQGIAVDQYDLNGNFVQGFVSISEAQRTTNTKGISNALNDKTKLIGGFYWRKQGEEF